MTIPIVRLLIPILLVGVLSTEAWAQPRAGQGRRGGEADAPALTPLEVLNMLDAYALVQAQNALDLNDQQFGEFVARLKRLQQTRRRGQQARNGLIADLRRLTNQGTQPLDEPAVRDRLRLLREHDAKVAAEMKTAYDALDEVLDLRQQARFRVFEEALERRKLDLLIRARRNAAGRGQ